MITIQFSAPSHPELCSMLRSYLTDMDGDVPQAVPAAAPAPVAAAPTAAEGQKRRGRPPTKKDEWLAAPPGTPAPPTEQREEPAEAAPEAPVEEAASALTLDDVKAALATLSEQQGIQVARDLCVTFQVASIKALPEERYAEFVAACKARAA